jgi:pSer/pThr/pTyr-binding forkhead associated (FHA) protein
VSRAHALVEVRPSGSAVLADLESSAGTYLNGSASRLMPMAGLGRGDVARLGTRCVVSVGEPERALLERVLKGVEERKALRESASAPKLGKVKEGA